MTRRTFYGMLPAVLLAATLARAEDAGWSKPATIVETHARLAVANQLHIVGHNGDKLVHRASADHGATWSEPHVIAGAAHAFPIMYGALAAQGDSVFLITTDGYSGGGAQPLDFWRSDDNGRTWSKPQRITDAAAGKTHGMFRARIVVSGQNVHVCGVSEPKSDAATLYVRSKDGGKTWDKVRVLANQLGPYGGSQTIAIDGQTLHVASTKAHHGVGGGDAMYVRSTDNGDTWSEPVFIGEKSETSGRQARIQLVAQKGHVLALWQREADQTGQPVPKMRLGYNTSADGGKTWDGAKVLPGDATNRNHQQICMTDDGAVHLAWREGEVSEKDPAGYMRSNDFGKTWEKGGVAFSTGAANHPYSIVSDRQYVYMLTGPLERMVFSRLPLKR